MEAVARAQQLRARPVEGLEYVVHSRALDVRLCEMSARFAWHAHRVHSSIAMRAPQLDYCERMGIWHSRVQRTLY